MTVTINAQATTGLLTTADGSGVVKLQSDGKTTNSLAWGHFTVSGTTPTVTQSYNLSSLTYNATGEWTAAFANALTNSTYAPSGFARITGNGGVFIGASDTGLTASSFRFGTGQSVSPAFANPVYAAFIVHGN